MQIDWFTLAAEVVNFLILLALLKKFLYDPILSIADRREEEIESRYEEAEAKEEKAEVLENRYEQKEAELEEKRESLLREARQEAEERRKKLLRDARAEVNAQKEGWLEQLRRAQDDFLRRLSRQSGEAVYETARRLLRDLADAELERQVVDVFTRKLTNLPAGRREAFAEALPADSLTITVQSTFELPEAERQAIVEAFDETFSRPSGAEFRFDRDEGLICGLALRVDGQQIAWNIDSYLDYLAESAASQLETEWTVVERATPADEETADGR